MWFSSQDYLVKMKDVKRSIGGWRATRLLDLEISPPRGLEVHQRLGFCHHKGATRTKGLLETEYKKSPGGVSGHWVGDSEVDTGLCSARRRTAPAGRWRRNPPALAVEPALDEDSNGTCKELESIASSLAASCRSPPDCWQSALPLQPTLPPPPPGQGWRRDQGASPAQHGRPPAPSGHQIRRFPSRGRWHLRQCAAPPPPCPFQGAWVSDELSWRRWSSAPGWCQGSWGQLGQCWQASQPSQRKELHHHCLRCAPAR